jgi:hypothetical protein
MPATSDVIAAEKSILPWASFLLGSIMGSLVRGLFRGCILQTLIAKDMAECGKFNHKLLNFFLAHGVDEDYGLDMVAVSVLFLVDETQVDEREQFARVSASNTGYKQFSANYVHFQKVLPRLEKIGFLKKEEGSNLILLENGGDKGVLQDQVGQKVK